MSGGAFGPPGGGGGFGSPPGGFGSPPGGFGSPPGGFGGGPPAGGGFGPPPGGGPSMGGAFGPPGGTSFGSGGGGGGGGGPLDRIPFTPQEEANIGGAGRFMFFAGVMSILTALVTLVKTGVVLWATPALTPTAIGGAVCGNVIGMTLAAVFGVWLMSGAKSLRAVVETDHGDQVHLIQAIQKLRQVFALKAALILMTIILVCVLGVVLGGAAVAMGAAR